MGDLTKNLSRWEFKASNGEEIAVDFELVNAVQDSCDAFSRMMGKRVYIGITSGYRPPVVNDATPGASRNSYHTKGMAADYHLYYFNGAGEKVRIKAKHLYTYLDRKYPVKFGLSLYVNRVHLDSRPTKWRDAKVKP